MTDIKKLERQIAIYENCLKDWLHEGSQHSVTEHWETVGKYKGKIELLGEQIAELRRAEDKRKQPEVHY